jgi:hypothetical protein
LLKVTRNRLYILNIAHLSFLLQLTH